jgi:hypothetical protein
MSDRSCPREQELLDALLRGFVEPEIAEHAGQCTSCGEIQLAARSLIDDRIEAVREAPVPSAGAMWLRMQMRAHQEARARARRSLLIGQAATLAIAIALVLSLFGADFAMEAERVAASMRVNGPLLIAFVLTIVAAPIAGYVAIRSKG